MTRDYLTLVEALGIPRGSIVALVGGGGKTSTLFRMVRESTRDGCRVLATTTARMKMEEIVEMRDVLLWDERDASGETWRSHRAHTADGGWIDKALDGDREQPAIPAAFLGRQVMRDKLIGLPTDYIGDLLSRLTWDMVYVEADGSRGRSIKGHRLGEPIQQPLGALREAVDARAGPIGLAAQAIGPPLDHAYQSDHQKRGVQGAD